MKYFNSKAIILRIKDLGESDLLVSFFTSDTGLLKGIAKAARKSRKRFVNCLDHFCMSHVQYHKKREGDLFLIDSCKLIQGFEQLRADYHLLTCASYFVELTETLFPLHVRSYKMFELLVYCFNQLCHREPVDQVRLIFEGRAMALGGYAINLERCSICGRFYRGEGRAVFVPEKGGIACLRCKKESKMYPGMDPESVRILAWIQEPKKQLYPSPSIPGKAEEELRRVLGQHVLYQLGRKLKTWKYIE